MDDVNKKENPRIKELEAEVHTLKEQLQNYIPRRRVRRVFKQLKKILEQDIQLDDHKYLDILKKFIKEIEVNGKCDAGSEIKEAIEYILSRYEIQEELESDLAYNAVILDTKNEELNKFKEEKTEQIMNQHGVPIFVTPPPTRKEDTNYDGTFHEKVK